MKDTIGFLLLIFIAFTLYSALEENSKLKEDLMIANTALSVCGQEMEKIYGTK